jgi:hypothetical protein
LDASQLGVFETAGDDLLESTLALLLDIQCEPMAGDPPSDLDPNAGNLAPLTADEDPDR